MRTNICDWKGIPGRLSPVAKLVRLQARSIFLIRYRSTHPSFRTLHRLNC